MRFAAISLVCWLVLSSCSSYTDFPDGFNAHCDIKGGDAAKDMAQNPPCAAATDLSGTNLLCVDFRQVQDLISDPKLANWDFTSQCAAGWSVNMGKLQIKGYTDFKGSCTFTMPPMKPSQYQAYSKFLLSVVHQIDFPEATQRAQIMLGIDDSSTRLIDQTTGKQPRKQWIHSIAKADLPPTTQGDFQPLFKILANASAGSSFNGWLIESIAINGVP